MVFRVTNQAQQQTALNNVFRISEDLFKVQNELASGKRIQRPSDDPSGTRQTLSLRTDLDKTKQFIRNIENMRRFTNGVDSAFENIGLSLIRARELTVSQLNSTATANTRTFVAAEIDNIIAQVISKANFRVGNRYVFGGTNVGSPPFAQSASGAVYTGNTEAITADIDINVSFQVNIPGSEVLAVDLNPTVTRSTLLSDLNGGSGVSEGSFTITDRAGNAKTVSVSSEATLGTVIDSINSLGINLTASINSNEDGITLADNSTLIAGALTVVEVGTGTTAKDLGILGSRNGNFTGLDLNPRLSSGTILSQLNGGNGMTLSDIKIINGSASGTVSFSNLTSSNTLGDLINKINSSGLNVTAGIGSGGNDLKIVSNNSSTVAVAQDIGTGTTAEILGIGGGRNIISTLVKLKTALERNVSVGMSAILKNITSGLETMGAARANIGSIERRLQVNDNVHDKDVIHQVQRLSETEDVDFTQKASELAALELAFQTTLNTTARILKPSILNFLG